jgi:hypothetical protein
MNNTIIYYYLLIKTYIINFYVYIKSKIFEINNVNIILVDNSVINCVWRYFFLVCINKLLKFLEQIKNNLDFETDRIEICTENVDGQQTIILDAATNFQQNIMTFDDVNYFLNKYKYNNNHNMNKNKKIYITFEIQNNLTDEHICLKDYVIKYNDNDKMYAHTLKNIVDFNKLNNNTLKLEESNVYIVWFENAKRLSSLTPYKECYNKHINDF